MKLAILITVALLSVGIWMYAYRNVEVKNATVESYVKGNISELSPVKASLGGTFYVTAFSLQDKKGTVEYEDGHNAYTADFTYSIDKEGKVSIKDFHLFDDEKGIE